ncbi:MAG: 50S ribosomal protein L32 [Deltaproteobacteria bacterium]|nr:50S ribosomal protein L32 [Deltaproteobacteria bacterium]
MPRPKRKTSHRRKGLRSAHDALKAPNLITCPNCQELTVAHRVCPACGYYKGKEVIAEQAEE